MRPPPEPHAFRAFLLAGRPPCPRRAGRDGERWGTTTFTCNPYTRKIGATVAASGACHLHRRFAVDLLSPPLSSVRRRRGSHDVADCGLPMANSQSTPPPTSFACAAIEQRGIVGAHRSSLAAHYAFAVKRVDPGTADRDAPIGGAVLGPSRQHRTRLFARRSRRSTQIRRSHSGDGAAIQRPLIHADPR